MHMTESCELFCKRSVSPSLPHGPHHRLGPYTALYALLFSSFFSAHPSASFFLCRNIEEVSHWLPLRPRVVIFPFQGSAPSLPSYTAKFCRNKAS